MEPVLVVGAGIAGLTAACLLAREGFPVVVLEREAEVGGLARSFRYGPCTFDIGPHRFYSANSDTMAFMAEVLGDEALSIPRHSTVYYLGRYHDWPLKLSSVLKMPPQISFRALWDLLHKNVGSNVAPDSFEAYILTRYGRTLYDTFFHGYTEKFIGIPSRDVHRDWAMIGVERATISEKIPTATLMELLKSMLMPVPKEMDFLYPPHGVDVFSHNLARRIKDAGGRILTSTIPLSLEMENNRITRLDVAGESFNPSRVIWTASITGLCNLLHLPVPDLSYLALIIANLELETQPKVSYQWCYYGDQDIVFSRSTNHSRFSPLSVPPGRGSLCIEVTCREGDQTWQQPQALVDRILGDLERVELLGSRKQVLNVHLETIREAYPVYRLDYPGLLAATRKMLGEVENLELCGRTALFWYNNMDHSIENAREVAGRVMGKLRANQAVSPPPAI